MSRPLNSITLTCVSPSVRTSAASAAAAGAAGAGAGAGATDGGAASARPALLGAGFSLAAWILAGAAAGAEAGVAAWSAFAAAARVRAARALARLAAGDGDALRERPELDARCAAESCANAG